MRSGAIKFFLLLSALFSKVQLLLVSVVITDSENTLARECFRAKLPLSNKASVCM